MGQVKSSTTSNQMNTQSVLNEAEVDVKYDIDSPRFSVQNIAEIQQGVEHLNEHGYAVFSNVLSHDEITKSVDLFWKYLKSLKRPYHIRRDHPQTWDSPWPGIPHNGLMNSLGIGQSEFMWSIRGNPNVKKVFSQIWDSNELFVSFDGAGCFRDWHLNHEWKTSGGWYHCDQNPFMNPDRCSIQGLVSLTDSDETTGGLVLVPDSHKHFLEFQSTTTNRYPLINYIRVPYQYPLLKQLQPRLIKCKAGDLIVWDSRCIHCNTPALVYKEKTNETEFLRIVAYICMSPSSLFVPDEDSYKTLEEFRRLREEHVRKRITCTHWPLQLIDADDGPSGEKETLKLNTFQHSLIVGTHVEPENNTTEIDF